MNFASIMLTIFFLIGGVIAGLGVRTVLQARESRSRHSARGIIHSSTVASQRGSKGSTEYRGGLIAWLFTP